MWLGAGQSAVWRRASRIAVSSRIRSSSSSAFAASWRRSRRGAPSRVNISAISSSEKPGRAAHRDQRQALQRGERSNWRRWPCRPTAAIRRLLLVEAQRRDGAGLTLPSPRRCPVRSFHLDLDRRAWRSSPLDHETARSPRGTTPERSKDGNAALWAAARGTRLGRRPARLLDQLFRAVRAGPLTAAVPAAARPSARVLDVGCGADATTLAGPQRPARARKGAPSLHPRRRHSRGRWHRARAAACRSARACRRSSSSPTRSTTRSKPSSFRPDHLPLRRDVLRRPRRRLREPAARLRSTTASCAWSPW